MVYSTIKLNGTVPSTIVLLIFDSEGNSTIITRSLLFLLLYVGKSTSKSRKLPIFKPSQQPHFYTYPNSCTTKTPWFLNYFSLIKISKIIINLWNGKLNETEVTKSIILTLRSHQEKNVKCWIIASKEKIIFHKPSGSFVTIPFGKMKV